MNQWSIRRKRIILFSIILVLVVFVGVPIFSLFYKIPNCSDGKQNGTETGIDCGGSCQLICNTDTSPLVSIGDPRVLEIAPNVYVAVAVVENPNKTGEILKADYTFKIYGTTGAVPIKTIEGSSYVPKSSKIAIFEGPFSLEVGLEPRRAVFEWDASSINWLVDTSPKPGLRLASQSFSREDSSPRLTAEIENTSSLDINNVYLVALVYDETGTIFAASKTLIESLPAGQKAPAIFAWARPFEQDVFSTDIIMQAIPDRSFVR